MTRFAISLLTGVAVLGFASTTFAADLIVDEPAAAPAMVAASGNWDGAYIGAFTGYGWGTLTDEEGYWGTNGQEYDAEGWQAGLTAGANFTISEAIVAGIAADIAWADIGGDAESGDFTYNTNWTGSLRGRLGFDGGAFLPYVTAGLAFANNTLDDSGNYEDTQTHIGWTAGVGVEFAVADNVSLDLQYRYSDYGSKTYSLDGDYDFSLTSHAVTAGINFKF
jgi:outer membrane immunogenic protein